MTLVGTFRILWRRAGGSARHLRSQGSKAVRGLLPWGRIAFVTTGFVATATLGLFPHHVVVWLLSLPVWAPIPLIVAACAADGELLRWIFQSLDAKTRLRATTPEGSHIVGYVFSVCGVLYAVVLAFVVVTAWQEYDHTDEVVLAEQNALDGLFSVPLPEVTRKDPWAFRLQLWTYAKGAAADFELANRGLPLSMYASRKEPASCDSAPYEADPRQGPGSNFAAYCIGVAMGAWKPTTPAGRANYQEARATYRAFLESRAHRIHHTNERLPAIMWSALIVGAMILVVFTFLFDERWSRVQAARTAALSSMIGIMLAEALVFDHPFTGRNRVDPSRWTAIACEFSYQLYLENHIARAVPGDEVKNCSDTNAAQ